MGVIGRIIQLLLFGTLLLVALGTGSWWVGMVAFFGIVVAFSKGGARGGGFGNPYNAGSPFSIFDNSSSSGSCDSGGDSGSSGGCDSGGSSD